MYLIKWLKNDSIFYMHCIFAYKHRQILVDDYGESEQAGLIRDAAL